MPSISKYIIIPKIASTQDIAYYIAILAIIFNLNYKTNYKSYIIQHKSHTLTSNITHNTSIYLKPIILQKTFKAIPLNASTFSPHHTYPFHHIHHIQQYTYTKTSPHTQYTKNTTQNLHNTTLQSSLLQSTNHDLQALINLLHITKIVFDYNDYYLISKPDKSCYKVDDLYQNCNPCISKARLSQEYQATISCIQSEIDRLSVHSTNSDFTHKMQQINLDTWCQTHKLCF